MLIAYFGTYIWRDWRNYSTLDVNKKCLYRLTCKTITAHMLFTSKCNLVKGIQYVANMCIVKTFLVLAFFAHAILGGGKDKKARKEINNLKKQIKAWKWTTQVGESCSKSCCFQADGICSCCQSTTATTSATTILNSLRVT